MGAPRGLNGNMDGCTLARSSSQFWTEGTLISRYTFGHFSLAVPTGRPKSEEGDGWLIGRLDG